MGVIVTRMAEELAKLGHEVYMFTRWREGLARHSKINEVHYYRCVFDPGADIITFFSNMSRAMLNEMRRVVRGSGRFDLIHGHDWHIVDALFELKKEGYPIVLSYHSTEYSRRGGAIGTDRLFKEISTRETLGGQLADRVVTVSKSMKRELTKIYQVPEEKIDVIPNAITVAKYQKQVDARRVKRRFRIPPSARTVLFMGRLEFQKGPDLLIDAAREVGREHDDAVFLFAGTGTMAEELSRRVAKLGLEDRIKFLGWIPYRKYVDLLNTCDIMCIPSRQEPFGIILLEAWATGLPVVATDVGGLGENVRHLVNGIRVKPDPKSIAGGIRYLLKHPEVMKRIGENGRKRARRFNWQKTIRKLLRTYRRVLEGIPPPVAAG
jgi:glycosyltransferase involved in cell wall biosynthesis